MIAVNSRSPPERRRFSLAHELGLGGEPLSDHHRLSRQDQTTLVRTGVDDPAMVVSLDLLDRGTFAANMLFGDAGEENCPRNMPADAWFGFKGCDRFEVEEQSFRLPGDEVLTVLKLPDEAIASKTRVVRHRRTLDSGCAGT